MLFSDYTKLVVLLINQKDYELSHCPFHYCRDYHVVAPDFPLRARQSNRQDAIVEQTRRIRKQIEQEFGNDPKKYLLYVYEAQKQHGDKLVRRKPKPMRKRKVV
ncbi:MAG: hypothetical protein ABIF19_11190 [Planctomycetota bacterium]